MDDIEDGNAPSRTRRGLLRAVTAGALPIAGCFGRSGSTPTATDTPSTDGSGTDTPAGTTASTGTATSTSGAAVTPYTGPDGGIERGDGDGAAFLANSMINAYSHHPQAEYAPGGDRTFLVYQSSDSGLVIGEGWTDGDPYAVAFDHAERRVLGPVRVGLNPLEPGDYHGVPALTIDGDGHVHVFFGCHGGYNAGPEYQAFQYARTAEPYSIDRWVHPPTGTSGSGNLPAPPGTYPCPAYDPGDDAVYVLYRAGTGDGSYPSHVYATLARSDDGGETWTDVNEGVLDFSGAPGDHYDAYVKDLGAWAGRIHLTWNVSETDEHGAARHNVYHAAYDPDSGRMQTTSGDDLGEAVTWEQAIEDCLVKDTGDVVITGNGDSIRGFNHGYDPGSDTAYIPASYGVDEETSATRLYSYEGVSEGRGEWTESEVIVEESPPRPWAALRVGEAGRPEINKPNADGERGLWVQREDGRFEHRPVDLPDGVGLRRPVRNSGAEFSWFGSEWIAPSGFPRGYSAATYAYGEGMAGSATHPRPPRNLRVTGDSGGTVTVDWDEGLPGPAGLKRYDVYVDGEVRESLSEPANGSTFRPATFASLDLDSGDHEVWVTLTTGDGVESGRSNVREVSVGG